jgi:sterol desaturase/sphingolipid hydroxylase (fatty acid hydroxylase superfamily)
MPVIEHESALRLGVFLGVLVLMSSLEALAPRRERRRARKERWTLHMGLAAVGGAAGRLLAPVGAVAAATYAEQRGWGLLHQVPWTLWAEGLAAFVFLDLAVYAQHFMSHRWGWLWRLHRLHHEDVDLDATSGVRFHPMEIAVSVLWKALVVIALGASAPAVVIFEIALNASSTFHHANLKLPAPVDGALRLLVVTPDMHRVHHSIIAHESRRNFGFAITLWDRLFRTYQSQPAAGHVGMVLGVDDGPVED